jgi:hypothetical protein
MTEKLKLKIVLIGVCIPAPGGLELMQKMGYVLQHEEWQMSANLWIANKPIITDGCLIHDPTRRMSVSRVDQTIDKLQGRSVRMVNECVRPGYRIQQQCQW